MHREMGQPSLVESLLPEKLGQNQRLERIHQAVDWGRLRKLAAQVYGAPEGRPSYPPLLMVKVLLLEQWYNLSDPQMEEALGDRISFRRFVGLGLQEDAPDHSTISRFRTALAAGGLDEKLFQELGPPVGAARAGAEGGDPDGRHRGGRPGAQTADVGGPGGPEAPSTPMRTGRIPIAGGDRTSATRCMWRWMRDRGSCARRC